MCCGWPALVGVALPVGLPPVRLAFRFRPWGGRPWAGGVVRAGLAVRSWSPLPGLPAVWPLASASTGCL